MRVLIMWDESWKTRQSNSITAVYPMILGTTILDNPPLTNFTQVQAERLTPWRIKVQQLLKEERIDIPLELIHVGFLTLLTLCSCNFLYFVWFSALAFVLVIIWRFTRKQFFISQEMATS